MQCPLLSDWEHPQGRGSLLCLSSLSTLPDATPPCYSSTPSAPPIPRPPPMELLLLVIPKPCPVVRAWPLAARVVGLASCCHCLDRLAMSPWPGCYATDCALLVWLPLCRACPDHGVLSLVGPESICTATDLFSNSSHGELFPVIDG